MRRTIVVIYVALIVSLNLSATTYEDAEDKKISRWEPLNPSSLATIENIYDKSKESQVISFKGEGTRSAYILMSDEGTTWDNREEKVLHWQMKYAEDFVVFVSLDTKKGKRYLIYTPGSHNGYMQYGLGENATAGVWQRYSRNLEKDLKYFDNQNSIIAVNSFVIRGSGSVDNIKMMKEHAVERKKRMLSSKKEKHRVLKKEKHEVLKKKVTTNSTPSIIIEGENPMFLMVGETFDEPGVKADDKEDGELVVTSSENIDRYKEGKYAVIYMATDSDGNSAIDKRYVTVGEPPESNDVEVTATTADEHSSEKEQDSNDSTQESDEEFRLEERELEISEWEKELQLREQEISQREQNLKKL